MRIGTPEIIILLVIIVLLFGVGRISQLGKELGSGLRAFRDEMKSPDSTEEKDSSQSETIPPADKSGE